jgi:hypothetical protein
MSAMIAMSTGGGASPGWLSAMQRRPAFGLVDLLAAKARDPRDAGGGRVVTRAAACVAGALLRQVHR